MTINDPAEKLGMQELEDALHAILDCKNVLKEYLQVYELPGTPSEQRAVILTWAADKLEEGNLKRHEDCLRRASKTLTLLTKRIRRRETDQDSPGEPA